MGIDQATRGSAYKVPYGTQRSGNSCIRVMRNVQQIGNPARLVTYQQPTDLTRRKKGRSNIRPACPLPR